MLRVATQVVGVALGLAIAYRASVCVTVLARLLFDRSYRRPLTVARSPVLSLSLVEQKFVSCLTTCTCLQLHMETCVHAVWSVCVHAMSKCFSFTVYYNIFILASPLNPHVDVSGLYSSLQTR